MYHSFKKKHSFKFYKFHPYFWSFGCGPLVLFYGHPSSKNYHLWQCRKTGNTFLNTQKNIPPKKPYPSLTCTLKDNSFKNFKLWTWSWMCCSMFLCCIYCCSLLMMLQLDCLLQNHRKIYIVTGPSQRNLNRDKIIEKLSDIEV